MIAVYEPKWKGFTTKGIVLRIESNGTIVYQSTGSNRRGLTHLTSPNDVQIVAKNSKYVLEEINRRLRIRRSQSRLKREDLLNENDEVDPSMFTNLEWHVDSQLVPIWNLCNNELQSNRSGMVKLGYHYRQRSRVQQNKA